MAQDQAVTRKPPHPYWILAAAVILPGAGHVVLGNPQRGLIFLFFTVILGWVSVKLMPESASFFSRHVGGIFIYGLSVIDSYKAARVKWEVWRHTKESGKDSVLM
jgi:hypothetical protein